MKKIFVINANNFSNLEGFYDEVQRVLTDNLTGFGRNLDAFNDMLRGGFGRFEYEEEYKLLWENAEKSKRDLGYPETIKYLKERLPKVHPLNIEHVRKELEEAEKGRGQTLFDVLIDIIKGHDHIKFKLN